MARNVHTLSDKDTIVAPATGSGVAAVAVVRLSGSESHRIGSSLCITPVKDLEYSKLYLRQIQNPSTGEVLDKGLVVYWKAPNSFTGEDVVEFHLHGSPAIVDRVVEATLSLGARMASPGEFSRRAWINNKVDLTQAEAIADLTNSQTDGARRAALQQFRGGLSKELLEWRHDLIQVTAELEAAVDYPEEDIPDTDKDRLLSSIQKANEKIAHLLESYERGKLLQKGARVVLAGPPNAGKSSLFNAILKRERAIVTPHAGTTRDTLEAVVDLQGIPLTLVDTAGLRFEAEDIEAMGIERSREEIDAADLILFVVDASSNLSDALNEYTNLAKENHLVIFNKSDLFDVQEKLKSLRNSFTRTDQSSIVVTSTNDRSSLATLEEKVLSMISSGTSDSSDQLTLTSKRHVDALRKAADALHQCIEAMKNDLSTEFIVVDLQSALSEIDSILGKSDLDEEILDAVFSTFCLGK